MGTPLTGKPIQVVVETDQGFKLEETALYQILLDPRVICRPVVVVSVAGAFRTGKSFLLNFFLRYLNAQEDPNWLGDADSPLKGFSWRGGSERNTTGILMWSEPFIIKRGEEEVAVLLMDTQGTFDSQSTVKDCATIFALSTMLSSVQVYNLFGNIQEDDLQHLQFFTEYGIIANMINSKHCRSDEKPFQTLQFLVRDWHHLSDASFGSGEDGGGKLLDRRLQVYVRQKPELTKIKNHIRSCFQRIDCYLMPYPGENVTENSAFDGRVKNMRDIFVEHIKKYVELFFDRENLVVKKINGSEVNGQELLEYFKAYVNIFQGDELPEPKTALQATADANNLAAVAAASALYCREMDSMVQAKPHIKSDDLYREHKRCIGMALDSFNKKQKMGDEKFGQEFAKNLELELQKLYENYIKLNESKSKFTFTEVVIIGAAAAAITVVGVAGVAGVAGAALAATLTAEAAGAAGAAAGTGTAATAALLLGEAATAIAAAVFASMKK